MSRQTAIAGAVNGYLFTIDIPSTRPAHHFTPRILPFHPDANIPIEASFILWKH